MAGEDGESGWYLGKTEPAAAAKNLSMAVGDFLQSRQDLAEVLTLPVGYLITLDATGVTAVLDEKGTDVWAPISK